MNYKRMITMVLAFGLMVSGMPFVSFAEQMDYEVVIEPQYEDAKLVSEGLAAVKKTVNGAISIWIMSW